MLFKHLPTITSDKIMLPKHQALAKAWDMSKQKTWGELTNIAIIVVSDMLKKRQLNSVKDLYIQMADMRALIGAILSHAPEAGKLGRGYSMTPIENHPDSGYKDLYPEFKSWVENLLLTEDSENFSLKEDGFLLKGVFKDLDNEESIESIRSAVYGKENFTLIHSQDQQILLYQANQLFKRLNESSLDKEEKKNIIEEIYFYLADAMPCVRGAGSIAQMLFYALEDAYIGEMRYLGKMSSKFGHEQGVTPDIAAMLSLTIDDFQDYLNNFVIDKDVSVIKKIPDIDSKNIEPEKMLSDIEDGKKAFEKFNSTLKNNYLDRFKKETIEPIFRGFLSLEKLAKKLSEDNNQLGYLQIFLTHLKKTIAANEICYPQLYELLNNKQDWPTPEFSTHKNIPENIDKNQLINSMISLIEIVHNHCYGVGQLYGWEGNTHHVASHYTAKKIIGISRDFNHEAHSLSQYFSVFESIVKEQRSGFGNGIDELIDILSIIDEDKKKNINQEETEEKIYAKIKSNYNKSPNFNRYHEQIVKRNINTIYVLADEINTNLKALAPFYDILKLKNENANDFFNEKKQKPFKKL